MADINNALSNRPDPPTDVGAAINLAVGHAAQAGREVSVGADTDFVVVPVGATLSDVSQLRNHPRRVKGVVNVWDAQSLAHYLHKYGIDEESVLYVSTPAERTMVGVIDHHSGIDPAWGQHKVQYKAKLSASFQAWYGLSGEPMTQESLAEFLEDHLVDIVTPSGMDLLEIVKTLQINSSAVFRRATRLTDGRTQILYSEDGEAKAGQSGEMTVPKEITIRVQPFEAGPQFDITVKLRYRQEKDELRWILVFTAIDKLLDEAWVGVLKGVTESLVKASSNITVLYGTPLA